MIRTAISLAATSLLCSSPVLASGTTSGTIPAAIEANGFQGLMEQRGAIGSYQVRDIMLPEADRIAILFTAAACA